MFLSKRTLIGLVLAGALTVSASAAFAKTGTYTEGQFTDVPATEWYANEVASAFELGLMNGTGGGLFAPDGDVTVAEAITMASRAAAINASETIDTATGGEWYTPYVNYAVSKGFVAQGQFDNFDRPAKRYEVAVIFEKAMPEGYFAAKNDVTAIPDVSEKQAYEKELLTLYKAGVVMGSDSFGNFRPEDNITRAEAAAIINRVALPENRLNKTLDKVSTDDAYALLVASSYDNGQYGVNSGWVYDNRGGTPKTDPTASHSSLVDISTEAGTAMIRKFNKTTTGTLRLNTSLATTSTAGVYLEFRNDQNQPVYHLEITDGKWQILNADGSYTALYEIADKESKFTFLIDIDLDNNRSVTYINDKLCGFSPLLTAGDRTNVLDFRFATTEKETATVALGAASIDVNYAVKDNLDTAKGWVKSDDSTDDTLSKGVSATRSFNPVSGTVVGEMYFLLPKAESVSYVLRSGSKTLVNFTTDNKNFYANGQKVYENYYANLWYRVRIEADTDAQKALIKINGRKVGEVTFAEAATSADNILVSNASETVPTLNDFRVFRLREHDDYVPKPVVPKGEENYTVGMNVCSIWTNGTHIGWNCISGYDDVEPVLGYYDEQNPETADWEIKYLVEHGVDFGAYCIYFSSYGGPQNLGRNHLFDGFMNAKYSDMSKFCAIWEVANGTSPSSFDSFKNDYAPYFIENFFKDPRHILIDNKPVLCVFGADKLSSRLGSNAKVKECFDYLEEEVKKIGFDGMIYLVCGESTDALAEMGFDGCYAYNWGNTGYKLEVNQIANTRSAEQGAVYTVPTISTGFNSVPWHGVRYPLMDKETYIEAQKWVKDDFLPKYAKEDWQKNFVMISTWNEYGEGTYIMPTTDEKGFRYLDVLREAYTDEKADESLNTVPSAAQRTRINRLYPQYLHKLCKQGSYIAATDTSSLITMAQIDYGTVEGMDVGGFDAETLIRDENGLRGKTEHNDPVLSINKVDFGLIVDNVTAIRVTAKIPKGNVMQIFYSTEENPGYAENRARVLTSDSDEMKEYLFDMSTALGWEGLLTGIRFDPVAAESVEVEIKSLEFLAKSQESSMEMTVNDLTFEMNLPYQKAENGDILAAFDPSLGMDLRLNTYAVWDKATETLTLNFTKHTLIFTVGSDSYTLDGEIKPLGYKIPTFDGLPMLPLGRICADIGYTYSVGDNGAVCIDTDQKDYFTKLLDRKEGDYEFNLDGDTEGWTSGSMNMLVSDGHLALTTISKEKLADPMMHLAEVSLPAAKYTKFECRVRYEHYAESAQQIVLYFITNKDPSWSESKILVLDLPGNSSNGEWLDLTYTLSDQSKWQDTIVGLRFDPFNAGGTMDIDYMRFVENPDYVDSGLAQEEEEIPFTVANGDAEDTSNVAFTASGKHGIIEDPLNPANHCYFVMPSDPTAKQWVYAIHPAHYKPGATYHVEADVQIYSLGHDTEISDGFRAEIICNAQYSDAAGNDHGVARTYATKGEWTHMSFDFTVSSKSKSRLNDRFTFYANPVDEHGVGFLLDNVIVTEVPKE